MWTSTLRLVLVVIGGLAGSTLGDIPLARADLVQCPYPGIGVFARVDVIASGQGFYCDFPQEINAAHWHCEQGSGGIGFNGGLSGPIGNGMPGSASGGGNFTFGLNLWSCSWRCADNRPAKPPNPPGAWKDKINLNVKCPHADPDNDIETVAVPIPDADPDAGVAGGVTNPLNPNPLAEVNP